VVARSLTVDLRVGARLAGEAKSEFNAQTVKLVEGLDVLPLLKVRLLGETRSDTAILALFKLVKDSDSVLLRILVATALGKIGSDTAIIELINLADDSDQNVRATVAPILAVLESEAVIPGLLKFIKRGYSFSGRKIQRSNFGSDAVIAGLAELAENSSHYVRQDVASFLDWLSLESTTPIVLKLLEDTDSGVRTVAAKSLGKLGFNTAIDPLIKLLEDTDSGVRTVAAESLGKLGFDTAIDPLIKLLDDTDSGVRTVAAKSLGKLGTEVALPICLKLIKDTGYYVREEGIKALGRSTSEDAISILLKLLEHPIPNVRRTTAEVLGEIGSEAVVPPLLKLLEKSDNYMRWIRKKDVRWIAELDLRWSVAAAIYQLSSEIPITTLIALVKDPFLGDLETDKDFKIYLETEVVLDKISLNTPVSKLLKLAKDSRYSVQKKAIATLGEIGSELAADALLQLVKGLHQEDVCKSIAVLLGEAGSECAVPSLLYLIEGWTSGVRGMKVRGEALKALDKIGSNIAIPGLLKLLERPHCRSVRDSAAEGLSKIAKKHPETTAQYLPTLLKLILTDFGNGQVLEAITTIQANCKYYNYEIYQAHLAAQKADRPTNLTSDRPITYEVNAEVVQIVENNYGTIHGKQTP